MRQLEAIEKVIKKIKEDGLIDAIFLKGSLARDDADEYSDVDLYCIVSQQRLESFLKNRLEYLNAYKQLVYHSESNFVGPQIVAVFEDGLHFDLYAVSIETLNQSDEIKVLYDPNNLLKNYQNQKFYVEESEISTYINEFSFLLLEFETAFLRNDTIFASRLANHTVGYLTLLLRYIYDEENAQLGNKRLIEKLPPEVRDEILDILDHIGPSQLPKGVVQTCIMMEKVIELLSTNIIKQTNIQFFQFMCKRINKLV